MPRARPLTKRQWQIVERVMTDHALGLVEEIGEYEAEIERLVEGEARGDYFQPFFTDSLQTTRRLAIEVGHQLEADQAILSKVRERIR